MTRPTPVVIRPIITTTFALMLAFLSGCGGTGPEDPEVLRVAIEWELGDEPGAYTFTGVEQAGKAVGWEWQIDDGSGPIEGQVIEHVFPASNTYEIVLLAYDASGDIAQAAITLDVAANLRPRISKVEIIAAPGDGLELSRERDLLCDVVASDEDGDDVEISYDWLVGGTSLSIDEPILNSDNFHRGDLVGCSATAYDRFDGTVPVLSVEVEVVNAPTRVLNADQIAILPATPTSADSLTVSEQPELWDADGDEAALEVSWAVRHADGSEEVLFHEENATTVSELAADLIVRGDRVSLTLRASDGTEVGDEVTATATPVDNGPPQITSDRLVLVGVDAETDAPVDGRVYTTHRIMLESQPEAVDPDGSEVLFFYQLERLAEDGEYVVFLESPVEPVAVVPAIEPAATRKGSYTLVVTPTDGHA